MKISTELFKRSKDLTYYFIASIIGAVLSVVLNPFISINMSKEDFGITGYYTSFNLLLLPIVSFSFLQYYNKSYFKLNENQRQEVLNTITTSQIIFGGVLLLLSVIGFSVYHFYNRISIPLFPYVILFFSSVFFAQFFTNYQSKLKFEKKSKSYLINALCQAGVHAAFVVLFVIAIKMKAFGYALASCIPSILMAIYSIFKTTTSFKINKAILRQALCFCWPLILANLMEFIYSGIDRSFLVELNDNGQLGLYNIAVTIGGYVTLFYTAIAQTFQPDLFESVSQKDSRKTIKLIFKIQILNVIPIFFFILLAPYIIDILTFGRYIESVPYAQIIALKGVFAALYFSLSSVIIASGLSKVTLLNKTIGTIAVYFLFKILISKYSYFGAAWGQALSYFVMVVISLVFIMYNKKKMFS